MTSRARRGDTDARPDPAGTRAVSEYLQAKKRQIDREIRDYPKPIPACDLQFNHLLEQRASTAKALAQLAEIVAAAGSRERMIRALSEFVVASEAIDPDAKARIGAILRAEGSTPPG